ncbi:hypothetical protein J6590_080899 [Homalodisca vitripennis]|nr:hypothetical protein J6590_080899 [Homalodisca vitripennis]
MSGMLCLLVLVVLVQAAESTTEVLKYNGSNSSCKVQSTQLLIDTDILDHTCVINQIYCLGEMNLTHLMSWMPSAVEVLKYNVSNPSCIAQSTQLLIDTDRLDRTCVISQIYCLGEMNLTHLMSWMPSAAEVLKYNGSNSSCKVQSTQLLIDTDRLEHTCVINQIYCLGEMNLTHLMSWMPSAAEVLKYNGYNPSCLAQSTQLLSDADRLDHTCVTSQMYCLGEMKLTHLMSWMPSAAEVLKYNGYNPSCLAQSTQLLIDTDRLDRTCVISQMYCLGEMNLTHLMSWMPSAAEVLKYNGSNSSCKVQSIQLLIDTDRLDHTCVINQIYCLGEMNLTHLMSWMPSAAEVLKYNGYNPSCLAQSTQLLSDADRLDRTCVISQIYCLGEMNLTHLMSWMPSAAEVLKYNVSNPSCIAQSTQLLSDADILDHTCVINQIYCLGEMNLTHLMSWMPSAAEVLKYNGSNSSCKVQSIQLLIDTDRLDHTCVINQIYCLGEMNLTHLMSWMPSAAEVLKYNVSNPSCIAQSTQLLDDAERLDLQALNSK